jgi:tetratricopeptide (TPR) repeat protein
MTAAMNAPITTEAAKEARRKALQEALALHRAGKRELAMQRYVALLADDPTDAEALYYVAVLALQEGQVAECIRVIERAHQVGPPQARLHNLMGQAHLRLRQPNEALLAFERAIVVDPEFADAYGNRANILADMGRRQEALADFDQAVRLRPNSGIDICNRAAVLLDLGRLDEARVGFDRAIFLMPSFAPAYFNRADALRRKHRFEEALRDYDKAIELHPSHAAAHNNRGLTLKALDRLDEALASFERALELKRDFADAHANRGGVLNALNRLDEAMASHERALAINPQLAASHFGRGLILIERRELKAAREAIERAVAIDPNPSAMMGLATLQLLVGDWEAGWLNYEHRTHSETRGFKPLNFRRWNGERLPDERLVLVTEQGFGDVLQFARFGPELAKRGFAVSLLAPPALVPILSTLPEVSVVATEEELQSQDARPICWAPLMSAPRILGITPDNVPSAVPYLAAQPDRAIAWQQRLSGPGFKIGIAWRIGTSRQRAGNARSIPLGAFASLAAIDGVRLISIQVDASQDEIEALPFGKRIETFGKDFDHAGAFLDTAAVMMNLDLIVSCDTSVAHLAGALARPLFLALPRACDWRWLLDRDDTPWYPTARLFRQSTSDEWRDVFERIAAAVVDEMRRASPQQRR